MEYSVWQNIGNIVTEFSALSNAVQTTYRRLKSVSLTIWKNSITSSLYRAEIPPVIQWLNEEPFRLLRKPLRGASELFGYSLKYPVNCVIQEQNLWKDIWLEISITKSCRFQPSLADPWLKASAHKLIIVNSISVRFSFESDSNTSAGVRCFSAPFPSLSHLFSTPFPASFPPRPPHSAPFPLLADVDVDPP